MRKFEEHRKEMNLDCLISFVWEMLLYDMNVVRSFCNMKSQCGKEICIIYLHFSDIKWVIVKYFHFHSFLLA